MSRKRRLPLGFLDNLGRTDVSSAPAQIPESGSCLLSWPGLLLSSRVHIFFSPFVIMFRNAFTIRTLCQRLSSQLPSLTIAQSGIERLKLWSHVTTIHTYQWKARTWKAQDGKTVMWKGSSKIGLSTAFQAIRVLRGFRCEFGILIVWSGMDG
jgi:hypothetical protein